MGNVLLCKCADLSSLATQKSRVCWQVLVVSVLEREVETSESLGSVPARDEKKKTA